MRNLDVFRSFSIAGACSVVGSIAQRGVSGRWLRDERLGGDDSMDRCDWEDGRWRTIRSWHRRRLMPRVRCPTDAATSTSVSELYDQLHEPPPRPHLLTTKSIPQTQPNLNHPHCVHSSKPTVKHPPTVDSYTRTFCMFRVYLVE